MIRYILETKNYATLHNLLQFKVLNDTIDLARSLINIGCNDSKLNQDGYHYEPAFQYGLDMLKKLKSYDEIVVALLNEGHVIKALNFAVEFHIHSMKRSTFIETAKTVRSSGNAKMADLIIKRIQEIVKVRLS